MFEHCGEAWRGLMMKKHPKAQGETRVEKGLGKLEVGLEENPKMVLLDQLSVISLLRNYVISISLTTTQTFLVPSHSG